MNPRTNLSPVRNPRPIKVGTNKSFNPSRGPDRGNDGHKLQPRKGARNEAEERMRAREREEAKDSGPERN